LVCNGNVAVDIARILLKDVNELKETDITSYALEKLSQSKVREVHIIGRRGPVQAAFTTNELRELIKLQNCNTIIADGELPLTKTDTEELRTRKAKRMFELLQSQLGQKAKEQPKSIIFHFLKSPHQFFGSEARLTSIKLERNKMVGNEPGKQRAVGCDIYEEMPCKIAFRSIGYKSIPIPGLPFDATEGIVPNINGRVKDKSNIMEGMYVTGWIKRGPTGIIATNIVDAEETVRAIVEDIKASRLPVIENPGFHAILELCKHRNVFPVTYENWQKINEHEEARGKRNGKPREKFVDTAEMLNVIK